MRVVAKRIPLACPVAERRDSVFRYKNFDPITKVMTPALVKTRVLLEPDPSATARVAELGDKSADTVTEDECAEYKAFTDAGTIISLIMAKAHVQFSR